MCICVYLHFYSTCILLAEKIGNIQYLLYSLQSCSIPLWLVFQIHSFIIHVHAYTLHECRYTTAHKALAKLYFLTHAVHVTLTVLSTSFCFFWERFLNGEQRKRRVSCMTKNTSASDTAGLRRRDSRSRREGIDGIWTTYILDLR